MRNSQCCCWISEKRMKDTNDDVRSPSWIRLTHSHARSRSALASWQLCNHGKGRKYPYMTVSHEVTQLGVDEEFSTFSLPSDPLLSSPSLRMSSEIHISGFEWAGERSNRKMVKDLFYCYFIPFAMHAVTAIQRESTKLSSWVNYKESECNENLWSSYRCLLIFSL